MKWPKDLRQDPYRSRNDIWDKGGNGDQQSNV